MKAFYFAQPNEKLGYGDNRKIVLGETHTVDCDPKCCKQGLHGSIKLLDALKYANSSIVYLVDIDVDIDAREDKICGKERTYLDRYDMTKILFEFARDQALINIEKIKPYCTDESYTLICKWLETGDKRLKSAAEAAAWSAMWPARSAAAESAAMSTAESAAQSAARSTAWSAEAAAWSAEEAAWSTAESTARSAAWSAAMSTAESAVQSAEAARLVAESAAWSTARSEQNQQLTSMLREATGWDI